MRRAFPAHAPRWTEEGVLPRSAQGPSAPGFAGPGRGRGPFAAPARHEGAERGTAPRGLGPPTPCVRAYVRAYVRVGGCALSCWGRGRHGTAFHGTWRHLICPWAPWGRVARRGSRGAPAAHGSRETGRGWAGPLTHPRGAAHKSPRRLVCAARAASPVGGEHV